MCGPVVAEILAGLQHDRRDEMWSMLAALPWADLNRNQWRLVGVIANDLRSRGQGVPLTDIEIAVAAVGVEAALWSRDGDFGRVGELLTDLRPFSPSPR